MKQKTILWGLIGALLCVSCTSHTLEHGSIKVVMEDSSMSILYGRDTLYKDIPVGLTTTERNMTEGLSLSKASKISPVSQDYQMHTGKRIHCTNEGVSRVYTYNDAQGQSFDLAVQIYSDGVAFRYALNLNPGESVTDESTAFILKDGTKRWMQQYAMDYEGFFPLATDGQSKGFRNKGRWGFPGLVEHEGACFSLFTEANIVRGNAGSQLYNDKDNTRYELTYASAMRPQEGNAWVSPWRLIIIGSLSTIVESTLVTDVSEPARYDVSEWAKPGLASWIYWANNHGSQDYQILKTYIDLAADMGWPYSLVDAEWDRMGNGGDLNTAVEYAKEKGVKLLLWYNSSTSWLGDSAPTPLYRLNKPEDRKAEYKWLAENAFAGVKIDFFPDDAAATMNYYIDLVEDAAAEKLMVNLHGATLPRGWQRTYPNLMSVEAVYGAEWYNNNPILTPRAATHNATIPFTRGVVGSMDYTPGTFSDSQHPHITTWTHELALPVLFESSLQHMPDRPEVYQNLRDEVRELLSGLPTVWEDTKLLGGYPGEYAILARLKDGVWYVAGVNGKDEEQTVALDLSPLASPGTELTLFTDGESDSDIHVSSLETAQAPASVKLRPRGGFVAVIK